jgi:hypothetical protein
MRMLASVIIAIQLVLLGPLFLLYGQVDPASASPSKTRSAISR